MNEIKCTEKDYDFFRKLENKISDISAGLTDVSVWLDHAFEKRTDKEFEGMPISFYIQKLEEARTHLAYFENFVYGIVYSREEK